MKLSPQAFLAAIILPWTKNLKSFEINKELVEDIRKEAWTKNLKSFEMEGDRQWIKI